MVLTITLNPCVDRLIHIDRLLPNDTNRILRIEEDAGGKGVNVARVLHRLGTRVTATGLLGGAPGSYVEHVLEREGVATSFVPVGQDTRTNFAIQTADGSPPTTLNAKGPHVTDAEMAVLLSRLEALMHGTEFVVLGGSRPPGLPPDINGHLMDIARRQDTRVVLDADGEALESGVERRPFMVKPNEYEVERLTGRAVDTLEEAASAAMHLHSRGVAVAIVSMGALGAAAAAEGCTCVAIPPQITAVSTIGSGDSMVAGVLSILCAGGGLEDALRWGAAAGAATAMTDGTDIGTAEQIRALVPQVEVRRLA